MKVALNSTQFEKQLFNVIDYSLGFIDGVEKGKTVFLKNLALGTIEVLKRYIDSNARINQNALQHMYEWYKTGSPEARLFDITYSIKGEGISINSTFRQSTSVSKNNEEPFYNKAKIMERGIPITIRPKNSSMLVFEEGGKTIFTKKEINIHYPGGPEARGSYQRTFDDFFRLYFSQAFLKSSGILEYIENPKVYKYNIAQGAKMGRSIGTNVGYKWIIEAKVGIE